MLADKQFGLIKIGHILCSLYISKHIYPYPISIYGKFGQSKKNKQTNKPKNKNQHPYLTFTPNSPVMLSLFLCITTLTLTKSHYVHMTEHAALLLCEAARCTPHLSDMTCSSSDACCSHLHPSDMACSSPDACCMLHVTNTPM